MCAKRFSVRQPVSRNAERTEFVPLPPGFRLALDPAVRRIDGGRVLVGGAPTRGMRLTAAGAAMVDRFAEGEPVPASPGAQRLARRLLDGALAHPRPHGPAPTARDVTLVIPVRDRASDLARTITAAGSVGAVVVVDDGSADPATIRAAAGDHVTVLRRAESGGPGAARQLGWEHAATDVIAFLDADVEPETGWLDGLLAHLADPAVGAAAPRVAASVPGATPRWLAAYEATRSPLDLGGWEAPVRPRSRVPYVPTAALVVRRAALDAVGGFDLDLRVGEDVDLVWRLHCAGWGIRYEPRAVVAHPVRTTPRAWLRQRFDYGSSAAPLAARHGDAVAPLMVSGWSAAAWALVGTGHPVAGVAVGASTTALLAPKLEGLERPLAEAARLAGLGHLWAGRSVADALRRPWWPLALVVGILFRRTRPALLAAAVVPSLIEWKQDLATLDPARYSAIRLVDDLAYGAGVWAGCIRHRSFAALRPAFTGRFPPPEPTEAS